MWAEMEAMGPEHGKKANLAEARKVATETLGTVELMIEALSSW